VAVLVMMALELLEQEMKAVILHQKVIAALLQQVTMAVVAAVLVARLVLKLVVLVQLLTQLGLLQLILA
jgi:hypothetical protein